MRAVPLLTAGLAFRPNDSLAHVAGGFVSLASLASDLVRAAMLLRSLFFSRLGRFSFDRNR